MHWRTFLMHLKALAMFSNRTKKRSVLFKNHFKTFGKRFWALKMHLMEHHQFAATGTVTKHSKIVND